MAYQVGCLPIGFGTCVPPTTGGYLAQDSPKEGTRLSGARGLFLKQSLSRVPGLLDDVTAPIDVLPVSSSLRRVVGNLKAVTGKDERPRLLRVAGLISLFVALDASKGLAVAWATVADSHTNAAAIVCVKNLLSISFGLSLAILLDGRQGFCMCFDVGRCVQAFPVAALFSAAQVVMMHALNVFDAGSLKVMAQVNLPTTVIMSWLLLGHRYSGQQWSAIALLLGATTAFMQVRLRFFRPPHWSEEELSTDETMRGIGFVMGSIMLSCFASICAECYLKSPKPVPFYIQKTNLMWGELVMAVSMAYLSKTSDSVSVPRLLYTQFSDFPRLLALMLWFIHGWMAGLLVKHCSVLVKNISHIVSALVMYFLPLILVEDAVHFWPVSVVASLVLVAILTFAVTPVHSRTNHQRGGRHGQSHDRTLGQMSSIPELASTPNLQDMHLQHISSDGRSRLGLRRTSSLPSVTDMLTLRSLLPRQLPSPSQLCVLIVSFVFLDALKPLLVSWAHSDKEPEERFINGTFVLVQTTLSFLVGLGIAARPRITVFPPMLHLHADWRDRLQRCMDAPSVFRQLPVSGCLVMSKWCLVMALERLDAGTVRVLCQSSLPVVGICTSVFFQKHYSVQQWASLLAVTCGLFAFSYVQTELSLLHSPQASELEADRYRPNAYGVLFIFCSISCNCLGALLVEKFLKQQSGKLYEQKAQLVLGEVIINALLVFVLPMVMPDSEMRHQNSPWARGFFVGWDSRVWCCVLIWIPAGWTATMLVKECSNLMKTVAQGAASVLTYIFSVMLARKSHQEWTSPVMFLAMAVMFAALTFGMDPGTSISTRRKSKKADSQEWLIDSSYTRVVSRGMGA
mmetsp:Transcript_32122/g.73487  ORF Transcript_32122/g.73487 Transcript_32122/m.73487 type:complete len:853 (-) Transcript_32122:48-2606(-)